MTLRERVSAIPADRQILIGGVLLSLIVALGLVIYAMFFRAQYDVLFADVRPADAAAIVEELQQRDIPYKLSNNDTSILVPIDQMSETRIAIAGSDLPTRGAVGFELFNESDMGLTEFAQKINYQRALQGEIARTITMMDEIEATRVHLAIPERAIFRGEKSVPKAAVTIRKRIGRIIDSESIDGIQKLVASAVNDLQLADVSVLDENGRVISRGLSEDEFISPDVAEKNAVEQYYRARIVTALKEVDAGRRTKVDVTATGFVPDAFVEPNKLQNLTDQSDDASASTERNFRLLVKLNSQTPPNQEDIDRINNAVKDVIRFDKNIGDRIVFSTLNEFGEHASDSLNVKSDWGAERTSDSRQADVSNYSEAKGPIYWLAIMAAALISIFGLLIWLNRKRGDLSDEERSSFAKQISDQLVVKGKV